MSKRRKKSWILGMIIALGIMISGCQKTVSNTTEPETAESKVTEVDVTGQETTESIFSETLQEESEKETTDEDLYFAQREAYWKSFQVGSAAPQISDQSVSWYADLDHDGEDERIVFDWFSMAFSEPGIFAVIETDGRVVYLDEWIGTSHVGWMSYYVCQRGEQEYLLVYVPYTGTGWGDYRYELMELNPDGQMEVIEQDATECRLDPIEHIKNTWPEYRMDISDMAAFAEGVNELLETSYLLVSTDQGWMNGLNYTDQWFVLGSENEPHRQYEVYHDLGHDMLTLSDKEKPEQGSLYKRLRDWCEKEGMPYLKTIQWEADLTHDGEKERIIFDWTDCGGGDVGSFMVQDMQGQQLYSAEIDDNHGTSSTYYLCQWQGQEYLFYYKPYVIMGEGYNRYELFSFTEDGEKVVKDSGSVRFHVEPLPGVVNEYGKKAINISEMVAFANKVDQYIQQSYLLICSDSDWLQAIPYEKGQYFVAGNPENPYRQSETYHWFNDADGVSGSRFGGITNVDRKLKAWCEYYKIPYIE